MASVIEDTASTVTLEAFDELVGRSKRSWALVLLAFTFGAVVAAVLAIKFRKQLAGGPGESEADGTATASGPQSSDAGDIDLSHASPWSRRRAQIAHTDAAMRARVGRAASRLNIRR